MKLAEWRREQRLTARQVAEQLGIRIEHVYRLEKRVHGPTLELARKIHQLTNGRVSYEDWGDET